MGSLGRKLKRQNIGPGISKEQKALIKDLSQLHNDFDRAVFCMDLARTIGQGMVEIEREKWSKRDETSKVQKNRFARAWGELTWQKQSELPAKP